MSRVPLVLFRYIGRHFLYQVAIVFALIICLILLFDLIELLGRTSGRDIPLRILLQFLLLRVPEHIQDLVPFIVLVGSILSLSKLSRSSEFVSARAAGVSVWQFMLPSVVAALFIGISTVTVLNPLSATMLTRFEKLEGRYFHGSTSMLSVSSSGLWLRQETDKGKKIIHALRVSSQAVELFDVTLYIFDDDNSFSRRIDAASARLEEGYWHIRNAVLTTPGEPARAEADYRLETNLSVEEIQESFAPPGTISFWELPGFINTLKEAGFSALQHRLHFEEMLALPLLLVGMVMISAVFSLHSPRQGKVATMLSVGVMVGILVRFFTNVISAFGLSGKIPVELAVWAPVCVIIFASVALVMHFEDS
jgi:lipopolysaccharide export system permease protein